MRRRSTGLVLCRHRRGLRHVAVHVRDASSAGWAPPPRDDGRAAGCGRISAVGDGHRRRRPPAMRGCTAAALWQPLRALGGCARIPAEDYDAVALRVRRQLQRVL